MVTAKQKPIIHPQKNKKKKYKHTTKESHHTTRERERKGTEIKTATKKLMSGP